MIISLHSAYMDIRCHGINKSFELPRQALEQQGKSKELRKILENYSCDIPSGSSYALLGESGSGKSTLLNLFAGLDLPDADSGNIYHDKTCINQRSPAWREQWRIQHIGILRQDPLLDPNLSAIENVLVPTVFRPIGHAQEQAQQLLRSLGLHKQMLQNTQTLSGGQRMRVALARALMGQPRMLIVDEPTGTLDHKTAQALGALLHQASHEHGFTLIIASHDLQLAERCDQCFDFSHSCNEATSPTKASTKASTQASTIKS